MIVLFCFHGFYKKHVSLCQSCEPGCIRLPYMFCQFHLGATQATLLDRKGGLSMIAREDGNTHEVHVRCW